MLSTTLSTDERITTAHRAKLAYVYVRQSSPGQVRHHQESTELQYRLVERAAVFGWPRERVHVIDDDLGKSGTSSKDRYGFQTLIAEVGLGKAGLVMSLDASRLARNNRDWHQLLELCSLFGVLIADGERLYDPAAYHDRLLLGLSGIMSEAELHQIKIRLHQGERQKAARGELRLPLPAGLIHTRDGSVTFNPDEEVQERLRLVFAKFRELRSAKAVMRYLRRGNLLLPVRPLHGPAPHDVVWRPADSARVINILKNPAYAGAYVYGRRRPDPLRRQPGSDRIGTAAVAPEDWSICLKDAHPAYLDWDEFMANRRQLADNVGRYDAGRPGAPRKGNALLQGIVSCGRCARRMCLRYSGPHGDYPVYVCVAASSTRSRRANGRPRRSLPLFAMTASKRPACSIGPINGERFRAYVEQFLVPTLKPGDAVILDNLGYHKGKAVRKAIRDVGARLVFLPKYSPDLNPIEQVFAKFKTLLRKAEARSYEAISDASANILAQYPTAECAAYLKNAGYG